MTFKDWWNAYYAEWQAKGHGFDLSPYDAAKAAYEAGTDRHVLSLEVELQHSVDQSISELKDYGPNGCI